MSSYYTGVPKIDAKLSRLYDLQVYYESINRSTDAIIQRQDYLLKKGKSQITSDKRSQEEAL